MTIKIVSFSYKKGVPPADKVVDCRSLPNPHESLHLRKMNGRDIPVQRYVVANGNAFSLIGAAEMGAYEGRTIAFGCFGGRHRSVACAELLGHRLRARALEVDVQHRDLEG
jgi:UPF0042 nucleotide-binding protein